MSSSLHSGSGVPYLGPGGALGGVWSSRNALSPGSCLLFVPRLLHCLLGSPFPAASCHLHIIRTLLFLKGKSKAECFEFLLHSYFCVHMSVHGIGGAVGEQIARVCLLVPYTPGSGSGSQARWQRLYLMSCLAGPGLSVLRHSCYGKYNVGDTLE